jgi:hypothetical protein
VKNKSKNSLRLLELETADLECFFGKKGLSPLGVKNYIQSSSGINMFRN